MLLFILLAKSPFTDKQAVRAISDQEKRSNNLLLINAQIKTIVSNKITGPELQYRLIELYSDRLKIIRDEENARFLKESAVNKKINKASFFTKSMEEYKKIDNFGRSVIQKNPTYLRIGEIYLTLGLNARDFAGDEAQSEKYLFQGLEVTPKNSPLVYYLKVALAEHFYTIKNFSKSEIYYQEVVKNKESEMLTKHLHNYAWCLIQSNKLEYALKIVHYGYALSEVKNNTNKKYYADMKEPLLYTSAYLYLATKKIEEGISFISKNASAPGEFLVNFAYKNLEIGDQSKTKLILDSSKNICIQKKDRDGEVKTYLAMLDIYRKKNDINNHFNTLKDFIKVKDYPELSLEDKKNAISEITDIAGLMQRRTLESVDRDYKKRNNFKPEMLEITLKYFDALMILDTSKRDQYSFFQAETLYGSLEYERALEAYKRTFEMPKGTGQEDLKKKSLTSMLTVLAEPSLDPKKVMDLSFYVYQKYLALYPKDELSKKLFPKLFNLYVKNNQYKEANELIIPFSTAFPQEKEVQKGMIATIVEDSLKKKDLVLVLFWFNKTKSGFLGFDENFKTKLEGAVASLYFEKIASLEKENKKEEAALEYLKIYNNNNFSVKIKSKAVFNASALYLEIGKFQESYNYLKISLNLLAPQETFELRDKILKISKQYYVYQELGLAADLSKMMLEKYCKEKFTEKQEFFSQATYFYLIDGKIQQSLQSLSLGKTCLIEEKKQEEVLLQNLKELAEVQNLEGLNLYYNAFGKSESLNKYFTDAYLGMYWSSLEYNQLEKSNQIKGILLSLGRNNNNIKSLFSAQEFVEKMRSESFYFFTPSEKFKEELFQKELDQAFKKLTQYTDVASEKLKLGYPQITLDIYTNLVRGYDKLANEIDAMNPSDEGPAYLKTFKEAMKPIVDGLRKKSQDFKKISQNAMEKNIIFTKKNLEIKNIKATDNGKIIAPVDTEKGIKLKGKK